MMEVGEGGGCNDKNKEIWNENLDGIMPEKMIELVGGLVKKGKELIYDDALMAKQKELIAIKEKEYARLQEEKAARLSIIEKVDGVSSLEDLRSVLSALIKELGFLSTGI